MRAPRYKITVVVDVVVFGKYLNSTLDIIEEAGAAAAAALFINYFSVLLLKMKMVMLSEREKERMRSEQASTPTDVVQMTESHVDGPARPG